MIHQFITIGILMLFTAMLPGPDFALVTKNTLFYSRRAGILTTCGIACAVIIHMSYCILGAAIIIAKSPLLFGFIKYAGAGYLSYIGIKTFFSTPETVEFSSKKTIKKNLMNRLFY